MLVRTVHLKTSYGTGTGRSQIDLVRLHFHLSNIMHYFQRILAQFHRWGEVRLSLPASSLEKDTRRRHTLPPCGPATNYQIVSTFITELLKTAQCLCTPPYEAGSVPLHPSLLQNFWRRLSAFSTLLLKKAQCLYTPPSLMFSGLILFQPRARCKSSANAFLLHHILTATAYGQPPAPVWNGKQNHCLPKHPHTCHDSFLMTGFVLEYLDRSW